MTAGASPRVTPFGGYLALAVAVVAGLALGVGVGAPIPVTVGVVGALVLVWAAGRAEGERLVDHAGAGVGVVVATLTLVGAVGLAVRGSGLAFLVFVSAAVFLVGADGLTAYFESFGHDVGSAAVDSAEVLVAALGLTVPVLVAVWAAELYLAVRAVTTWTLAISLQVQALAAVVLVDAAAGVVTGWLRGTGGRNGSRAADGTAPAGGNLRAKLGAASSSIRGIRVVPVLGLLMVQFLLAVGRPRSIDQVLAAVPEVGPAVVTVLQRQWLHRPLDALLAVALLVLAAEGARRLFVRWAEPDPPRTLGRAAGGVGAYLLVAAASAGPVTGPALTAGVPAFGPVPPVGVAAGLFAATLVVLFVALAGVETVATLGPVPDLSPGFALGAAALFLAAVGAGLAGAVPPLVFAAAAAAFFVWDIGATGARLGATLGVGADTQRGEFVLAATTALVGVGGAALASVALYVLGPLSVSVPTWRAYLAMLLALVALCLLALSAVRQSPA